MALGREGRGMLEYDGCPKARSEGEGRKECSGRCKLQGKAGQRDSCMDCHLQRELKATTLLLKLFSDQFGLLQGDVLMTPMVRT